MKKIPTLFEREYLNHEIIHIKPNVTVGMEWVLNGDGIATIKIDGSCCAIIDGEFYKRYDAKHGKKPPEGAIPCSEPDPITGHHPHWVKCDRNNPADKWFWEAYDNELTRDRSNGTYEAIGKHFNGNAYDLNGDVLIKHGIFVIDSELERTFDGIKEWLCNHNHEGIVFWKDGEPMCKIKRTDFGFSWNSSNKKKEK